MFVPWRAFIPICFILVVSLSNYSCPFSAIGHSNLTRCVSFCYWSVASCLVVHLVFIIVNIKLQLFEIMGRDTGSYFPNMIFACGHQIICVWVHCNVVTLENDKYVWNVLHHTSSKWVGVGLCETYVWQKHPFFTKHVYWCIHLITKLVKIVKLRMAVGSNVYHTTAI